MSKHTPGPWEGWRYAGDYEVNGAERAIATVDGHNPDAKANARLIAAAPELLAALREALDFIDGPDAPSVGMIVQDSLVSRAYVALAGVLESARAAIAKAEGAHA